MNMYGSTESVLTTESLDGYFTKHGKDKVFMTPHICIDFWAISAQGRIQGRAMQGQKGVLLQRTSFSELECYSNKPNV